MSSLEQNSLKRIYVDEDSSNDDGQCSFPQNIPSRPSSATIPTPPFEDWQRFDSYNIIGALSGYSGPDLLGNPESA